VSKLAAFGLFLYEFVVGDDPVIAAGVVVALALTAIVADRAGGGFWIVPAVVVCILAASLRRASTRSGS
jgi:hypothetical protein